MLENIASLVKRYGAMRLLCVLSLLLSGFGGTVFADATTTLEKDSVGYYLITSGADLEWFAKQVNSEKNLTICGKLTADIDITPEGNTTWEPIGKSTSTCFKGKFDGQGHTISGLIIRADALCGLFGCALNATIENVTLVRPGYSTLNPGSSPYSIGAVCGSADGTTIRNCHVTQASLNFADFNNANAKKVNALGGIIGEAQNSCKIVSCSVSGYVSSADTNTGKIGGIVGNLMYSDVDSCSVTNHDLGNSRIAGETCVGGIIGSSSQRSIAASVHNCTIADGVVIACTDTTTVGTMSGQELISTTNIYEYDGTYEIYNPEQLALFRDIVAQKSEVNGRLMNDIDMTNAGEFTPIASLDNGYRGTFDGQGYTISNITIKDQKYAGLFSSVCSVNDVAGTVKNVNLSSPELFCSSNSYLGLIAAHVSGNAVVQNCNVTNGTLERSSKEGEPNHVGGIVGEIVEGGTVDHCSFQGSVQFVENNVGGIAGYLDSGSTLTSCYVTGASTIGGNDKVGGIVGCVSDGDCTLSDCFVDQSAGTVKVYASTGNTANLIAGKDVTTISYKENGLIYQKIGKKDGDAELLVVTGCYDTTLSCHNVASDIGSTNDYATDSIAYLPGVKKLNFHDIVSGLPYTSAYRWPSIKIADGAFDSGFEELYLSYLMAPRLREFFYMPLRPGDIVPAGSDMFKNCPNAKVYVDAEYYDNFIADPKWTVYKDHIVPITDINVIRTSDFTEKGVIYAYNRNNDATATRVTKTGKDGSEVRMMHVIGCDSTKIADNDGVLKIYQDIGETYNYNTTKIWASSFKDINTIKQVKFEEIMADARETYYDFNIALGDSAFANCKNLEYFDLVLSSDKGTDHYSVIHPNQMPVGKGVFAGCSNLKIRIPTTVYEEFLADNNWNQYKELFVKTDFNVNSFTEKGVNYAYFVSDDGKTQYTNKNTEEMENIVTPWMNTYRNFKTTSVLVPDNDKTIYYLKASGVDDDDIDDAKGELRLYNDIGTTYNYKTIALSESGFQNNEHIKSIVFEDCASNVSNANTQLSLVIPDETFKGCKNLKELNMYYLVTDGDNHYEAIKPSEIFIGKNVFDGVDSSFRIKVYPDFYNDFITDANWSQYKDIIESSDYLPTTAEDITRDGLTYGFVSKSLNSTATTTTIREDASLLNIPIVIAEVASAVYTAYTIYKSVASSAAKKTAQAVVQEAEQNAERIRQVGIINNSLAEDTREFRQVLDGTAAALNTGDIPNSSLRRIAQDAIMDAEAKAAADINIVNRNFGLTSALSKYNAASTALNSAVKNATATALKTAATYGTAYIFNRVLKDFSENWSWHVNSVNWVTVTKRYNSPLLYIKTVSDDATDITIYADPTKSTTRHNTTAIQSNAFRNKTNLKTIKFQDEPGGTYRPYNAFVLSLPDSCFTGCSNLETIDLVMHSAYGSRDKSLTPDNFVMVGDPFAGLDSTKVKIIVGADVVDDYLSDDYWCKYSGMIKTRDVAQKKDQSEWSCLYTKHYDTNTMPEVTQVNQHDIEHVDIYGADDDDLKSNEGLAALINDYGIYNNYKLDNVLKKAFYKNDNLKQLDITDSHTYCGDVYTDFNVYLQDSCFAKCKNFTDFNLIYQVTDGTNKTKSLTPEQVTLGHGVFDGCDNLRLKVCLDQYDEFLADLKWKEYANQIKPCFFTPADSKVNKLLKDDIMFKTELNKNSWEHLDATRATPSMLKDRFKGTDIEMFDEFRAFSSCELDTVYNEMFKNCQALQSITLPTTIKHIGNYAFQGCVDLVSLTIPDSVKSIGNYVFQNSKIKTLVSTSEKPAEVENGGAYAFMGLPDDYVIYVPDSLVDVYKEKWYDAKDHINAQSKRGGSLKVVTVTEVGTLAEKLGLKWDYSEDYSYNQCRVALEGNYAQYDSLRVIGPLDARDLGVLRMMAGRNTQCEANPAGNLQYLDLYDAQFKKGSYKYDMTETFATNSRIDLDNDVSGYAFYKLDKLKTLILPKTATAIRRYALAECANLETIVVGDDVNEVNRNVVNKSTSLKYLVMLGTPPSDDVSSSAWDINSSSKRFTAIMCGYGKENVFQSDAKYNAYADTVFCICNNEPVFEIMKKNHVFSIDDLWELGNIKGFMNGNTAVTNFTDFAHTSVSMLGDSTFTDMTNLEEISLPSLLDTVTVDAFKGCKKLKKIWALSSVCPQLATGALNDLPTDFVIMVSEGYEEQYRKAWPEYANHIQGYYASSHLNVREITLTQPNTLADSLGLTITTCKYRITSDEKITRVDGQTGNISALKVNGPIGSKDIAVIRMLAGCSPENNIVYTSNLTYIDLYDAVLTKDDLKFMQYFDKAGVPGFNNNSSCISADNVVPEKMFYNCNNLETVILPRTATKIEEYALNTISSLKTAVIGDDVTEIEDDVLSGTTGLKSIVFLGDVPEVASDFFDDNMEGDVNKVDNIYVRKSKLDGFTKSEVLNKHTNSISSTFDDEQFFRAIASHGYATEDELAAVDSVGGWFRKFEGISDLTPLKKSVITSLAANDINVLTGLKHIALPSTMRTIEDNAFAGNPNLHWADLTECTSLEATDASKFGTNADALVYLPETFGAQTTANMVYSADGELKCTQYNMADRDYDVPTAFTASAVTFNRELTDSLSTLTLPFSCVVPEGLHFYELETAATEYNEARFQEVENIVANMPYVVKVEKTGCKFETSEECEVQETPSRMESLKGLGYAALGTLSTISAADVRDSKMLVMDKKGVWNYLADDATTGILPFSIYLQVTNDKALTKDVPSYLDNLTLYEFTLDEAQDNSSEIKNHINERVNANLKRTLVQNAWNTFCVPFFTYIEGSPLEGCAVSGVKEINDNVITYQTVRFLEPGQAYLVKPKTTITNPIFKGVKISSEEPSYNGAYDFIGTYSPLTLDETKTNYFLGSDGRLKLAKAGGKMKGMRAYFKTPSGGANLAKLVVYIDDEPITAIDDIEMDPETEKPSGIYSIDGVYRGTDLDKLPRGVYIMNGKKVIK